MSASEPCNEIGRGLDFICTARFAPTCGADNPMSKLSSSKLSSEQWLALRPHLEQAFDMAAPERAAWLCSIRAQNPVLGEQLASLLEEHDVLAEAGFLEGSVTPPSSTPGLAGQVVGPYTLISPLGQGGMGS